MENIDMIDCSTALLHFLVQTIADLETHPNFYGVDFVTERYTTEEYYEYNLLNDGSDILIRIYNPTDDGTEDGYITVGLFCDGLDPIHFLFEFDDFESDIKRYKLAMKNILKSYMLGNWHHTLMHL
ncbi:hypothetical protein ACVR1I_03490 [Streptococcus cameli]